MIDPSTRLTEDPFNAFVATVFVAMAGYAGVNLVVGGELNILAMVVFGVVFAVVLVGLALFRERYLQ